VRTTVDIPEESLRLAKQLSQRRGVSLGTFLGELIEQQFRSQSATSLEIAAHGFPVIHVGRPVSATEVAEHDKE
jgi:hypothetical protein